MNVPTGLSLGTTVAGRFQLTGVLGAGGYGTVYSAIQLNLGRQVALKMLHPGVMTRPGSKERFEQEARLAQRLNHPNVVRLFDFGQTENGQVFIVWEHLQGRSLEDELLRHGPMSSARVAHIAGQVLKALAEAHALGIVHRDIKPANVFLCDFAGERDFVKLLDFGIAVAPQESQSLTQEGVVLGTAAYMSPEQVSGEALDGRADLYAVGLLMSEMLSGAPVFRGATTLAVATMQLSPEPAPHAPIVWESPLFPAIARATAKPKEGRFSSALEMLQSFNAPRESRESFGTGPTAHVIRPTPQQGVVLDSTAMRQISQYLPQPSLQSHAQAPPITLQAAGSASVAQPVAAPAYQVSSQFASQALPRETKSKGLVWGMVAVGALALVGIGVALVALFSAPNERKKQKPEVVVVVSSVVKTEDDDVDIDRAIITMLTGALANTPKACKPLAPEIASWSASGLSLEEAVRRAENAGYVCVTQQMVGSAGTLVFSGPGSGSKGFTLHFGPSMTIPRDLPGMRTLQDPASGRALTIHSQDRSKRVADQAAEALATP